MHNSDVSSEALCIVIDSIELTSRGCYKISSSTGSIFFARQYYLNDLRIEELRTGVALNEIQSAQLIDSTLMIAAEIDALNYLNRSEHSRFLLSQKLHNKKHSKETVERVLDFLESENLLSDSRYAVAWLRNRRLNHFEGRTKLFGLLLQHGIDAKTAQKALDEFFDEFPEEEILNKAKLKFQDKGFSSDEINEKLMKNGFSSSLIKKSSGNF